MFIPAQISRCKTNINPHRNSSVNITMSDNIPFEIQSDIMKRLPVKSLIQFRSVCKAWKSLIDGSDFIKNYSSQQHHLLVSYHDPLDSDDKYVLIADDHTFPQRKVSVTVPLVVNRLEYSMIIGSSHGLLCLYGDFQEGPDNFSGTGIAVIWNPSIRKTVVVDVPNVADRLIFDTVLGFGVCPETLDPKILKITYLRNRYGKDIEDIDCIPSQVELFTLSTGTWRSPCRSNLPRRSIKVDDYNMVFIDGVFYWLALDDGFQSCNLIIAFDMANEAFREVNLPDCLAHQSHYDLSINKLRESLVMIEHNIEDNNEIIYVWMMADDVAKSFTKVFTFNMLVASEVDVMGFRKTGEPIIKNAPDRDSTRSLDVYEPYSNSISSLGINGRDISYYVYSYIETLLLL